MQVEDRLSGMMLDLEETGLGLGIWLERLRETYWIRISVKRAGVLAEIRSECLGMYVSLTGLSTRQSVSYTASGLHYWKNCSYVRSCRPQRERAENVAHIRKQISISITIVQACNCRNVNKNQIVSSVSAQQNAFAHHCIILGGNYTLSENYMP
jgi:hypothetical protein